MQATRCRLLADDLTGALDSAARFVPLAGPIPVTWSAEAPAGHAAIDSGTRELEAAAAADRVARLAPLLAGGDPAFKKIDSLLRGHVAGELAACMTAFDRCILAPAFPFQGRVTRNGRQLLRTEAGWRDVGVDLRAALAARGVQAELCDAETDVDLAAIVAAGRTRGGRILWCGTGGLAGALAGNHPVPCPDLPRPILALIGSDHPVSAAQLNAASWCVHRIGVPDRAGTTGIGAALREGAAAIAMALPPDTPRPAATRMIATAFTTLLQAIPRPGTLLITGGETLRSLCNALGVIGLEVDGEVVPGVPTSRMRGGGWDGQRIVSKSGAFGDAGFLNRLLRGLGP